MPFVLAGLSPVMSGILALMLLVAGVLLLDLIGRMLKRVDVIPLLSIVTGGINRGIHWTLTEMNGLLTGIAQHAIGWITALPYAIDNIASATYGAISRLQRWVRTLAFETVPAAFRTIASVAASITRYAEALVARMHGIVIEYVNAIRSVLLSTILSVASSLTRHITNVYNTLAQSIALARATVASYALGLYNNAIATISSVYATVLARINTVKLQLQAYALSLAQWALENAVRIATDWARRYADHVISAYNQALTAATALALQPAWPNIIDAIDSIRLALPESIAAVLARIGAIPRAIPRDIGLSIGAVAAIGAVSLDWVARCGVPLCRDLKGFGDELSALGDAAMMAVIMEMIIDAVSDPDSAAKDVRDTLVDPLQSVGREFASLIGTAA